MPYWLALMPPRDAAASLPSNASQQRAMGWWALQFTPRVALLEDAVVMEVQASQRLFGGAAVLRDRVAQEARALGCEAVAFASTSLGALALARCRVEDGFASPLQSLLDGVPLEAVSAVAAHKPTLARLGCRTLGDVRRLPRGGLSRRFGAELLNALDQTYGLKPRSHEWLEAPETFKARLELPGRVDTAPAMMVGAERLLTQMVGWLASRHAGVRSFTLKWLHDSLRPRDVEANGELTIRTAEITRNIEHLTRLLGEHLAKLDLAAPVGDLALYALEPEALEEISRSLLMDDALKREPFHELLERLAARLGPAQVRRPVLSSDHRLEWMQAWQPATEPLPRQGPTPAESLPQPTWVLPRPLKLVVREHKPVYQGLLRLLAGPHRVEAGWWHRRPALAVQEEGAACMYMHEQVEREEQEARHAPQVQQAQQAHAPQPAPRARHPRDTREVVRDYYIAQSPAAGLLWVYCERPLGRELSRELGRDGHEAVGNDSTWFLHGMFA